MFILPEKPLTFPSERIVQAFERLSDEDFGLVMRRYLKVLINRIRSNPKGECNTVGLYFTMIDTLKMFELRSERDAVQNAITAFVDRVPQYARNTREYADAERFIAEFHKFAKAFSTSAKSMTTIH